MAGIPITGIPSSYRKPGGYAEILFAQGASSAAAGTRQIVHVMPKLLASGTWTAATVYGPIKNEAEAIDGAGAGSPLHRALRLGLKSNQNARHYAVPYMPTSGGAAVAATGTIIVVFGGVNPTGTGVVEGYVCGEYWSCGIKLAHTITTLGDDIAAAINAKTWLPVVAVNAGGTVTLTAKILGASQGTATIGALRFRVSSFTSGIGVTSITASAAYIGFAPGVAGVEGAVTEATNFTAALLSIAATRRYYVVTSLTQASDLTLLKAHIVNKSQPNPGHRSVGVAANLQALADVTTIANTENYERLTIAWQKYSEHDPAELAAAWAAALQAETELDPAFNFDFYQGSNACNWLVKAAYAKADWPDANDVNDAINDGITVIESTDTGSFVSMAVSTRSKAAGGTLDDFRATELHRSSVCDFHTDELLLNYGLTYTGKKLRPDELLSNGKVNTNQKLAPNVITPSNFKPFLLKYIDKHYEAGLLKGLADTKRSIRCQIDPSNAGRIECGYDIYAIDLFHQLTVRVAESSTG